MSDIPEDIRAAATEALTQFRWNNEQEWADILALAIAAERARAIHCCKVAMANDREQFVMLGPSGVAMRIAKLIEQGAT